MFCSHSAQVRAEGEAGFEILDIFLSRVRCFSPSSSFLSGSCFAVVYVPVLCTSFGSLIMRFGDSVVKAVYLTVSCCLQSGFGDSSNFGCSPPYFCGSPPSRSGNPLIHDVQFTQRLPSTQSSLSSLVSQGKAFCGASYGANPSVRVEGFVSSSEVRCSVPALA